VDEVFSRYLDPAFRYVLPQNPARVRSRQDAEFGVGLCAVPDQPGHPRRPGCHRLAV
jgi:hypothetical protein